MEYEKADDISYVDLKEVCQIFNRQGHLLGNRINIRRKGFDNLMEAFIKAVMGVPSSQWKDIPDEVMAFFKALPLECFEAAHVAAPTAMNTIVCADDDIPEYPMKARGERNRVAMEGDGPFAHFSRGKERKPIPFPLMEGRVKVKTMISLMEMVRYLEDLVAALNKGQIFIESRNRVLMMKPHDPVAIKIKAGVQKDRKSRQEQMSIELEWTRVSAIDRNKDDFSISSKTPSK